MVSKSFHLWLLTPCLTQNMILSPTLKVHDSMYPKMLTCNKKPKKRRNITKKKVTTIFFIPHVIKYHLELLLKFGAFNSPKTSRRQHPSTTLFLSICFFHFHNLPPLTSKYPELSRCPGQNRPHLYPAAILMSPLFQVTVGWLETVALSP